MATASIPSNARMVKRIDDALERVRDTFDAEKLRYVRSQITPAGFEKRPDEDKDVSHLTDIAKSILKRYEKKEVTTDA